MRPIAVVAVLALAACADVEDDAPADGGDVAASGTEGESDSGSDDPDPSSGGDDEIEGDTEGDTEGETGGDEDDLYAECRAMPEAAGWLQGDAPASTASSTPERIAALAVQTWPLALDMLRVVPTTEVPSVANSPASMYAAMGLAYDRWQDGQCGDRIASVLRFPELGDDIHHTIGASIVELQSRAIPAGQDADPVALTMLQSLWQFGEGPLPELSELQEIYGARFNLLPAPDEDAREVVNCVIEAESQGLLPDFIPAGTPAPDTSSLDINVSFLQAPWAVAMSERPVEFHFEDGSQVEVEGFGSSLAEVRLHQGEAFTAVEIPLRGLEIAMLAIVPPAELAGGLDEFVASLDAVALTDARDAAVDAIVDLTMPKVDIVSQTLDYNDEDGLGFECEPFTLRKVLHGAAVEIDDKGIKAAAATVAEGWDDGGGPEPEQSIVIDRPFLFFVYDRTTDFVLYSGRWSPESA